MLNPQNLALLTDLYELTMAQAYLQHRMSGQATFSLFIRSYPPDRSYFVSAGLEDVLHYLEGLSFTSQDMDYLHSTGLFSQEFLDYLSRLRFTGEVWAIPEGRLFFPDEPVLEITAPIIEAQMVETYVINQINLQTLIATKAARCFWAARDRVVVDFSLRRAHGTDAGMKVARASYIAGFQATSNVLAASTYGLQPTGTMAHSFVTSFPKEIDAFRAYARSFPDQCVLLIDTYDTIAGAHKAVTVAKEMESRGQRLLAVRLDSGDMAALSKQVRHMLDEAGLGYVQILASGGLDEYEIDALLNQVAPIDGFGVGTKMGVSGDAPWLEMVYKQVEYGERPVLKLSTGKAYLPGQKQVFRLAGEDGLLKRDITSLRNEKVKGGEPLLHKVMEGGRIIAPLPSLKEIRQQFEQEFDRLPQRFKAMRNPPHYDVALSPGLEKLQQELQQRLAP